MELNIYPVPFENKGYCPCCGRKVSFIATNSWYRDYYICSNCQCIPRERAIMHITEMLYPNWRDLSIHESSPSTRGASVRFASECLGYTATQYFVGEEHGAIVNGTRNENLEKQTFKDDSFDLVITQDVMEHLFSPEKAFSEICRTLKPGGAHIFTTPLLMGRNPSKKQAKLSEANEIIYLVEPCFHGNPIDEKGSLEVYRWGYDIVQTIYQACGMISTIYCIDDINLGIRAELNEVIVSYKLY